MAGDSQNMERSTLERKDRAELAAVAAALGLKVPSRAKKADIVTLILDVVAQPGDGSAASPSTLPAADATSVDAPADSPADVAAEAVGEGVVESEPTSNAAATSGNGSAPSDRDRTNPVAERSDVEPAEAEPEAATAEPTSDHGTDESAPGDGAEADGEGGGRNRRRRRRGRDRAEGDAAQPGGQEFDGEPVEVSGLLDLRDDGYGFLRVAGFLPSRDDVYVSVKQCRQLGLRKGDHLTGLARPAGHKEKNPALTRVETVNGMDPEAARNRPRFDDLTPVAPEGEITLAGGSADATARLVGSLAPIAKGQRALLVAPPRSGSTTVLSAIAGAVEASNPDVQLIALLVDERPEDVTELRRNVESGEVVASTFDRPAEEHTAVAELTVEHAKRLVEYGYDVVILLDGLTRLTRAYNATTAPNGRILPGGLDAAAVFPPKRFFGAARNIEEGGSLTIVATVACDTGSALDNAILEEFGGTANRELRLQAPTASIPTLDLHS